MKVLKAIIEKFEKVIESVLDSASHLSFNKEIAQHLFAVSLNGSIVEVAFSCMILLKKKQYIGIPILLRNMLEAYVDLVNIVQDHNYSKYMQAVYFKEQCNFLKKAIQGGKKNPYLEALAEDRKLPEAYESACAKLEKLRNDGFKKLKVLERFELAGAEDLYNSIYPLLCRESHNNLSSLEKRHLKKSGDAYSIEYFKEWEQNEIIILIDSMAGIVVAAIKECYKLFDSKDHETLQETEAALLALREITVPN